MTPWGRAGRGGVGADTWGAGRMYVEQTAVRTAASGAIVITAYAIASLQIAVLLTSVLTASMSMMAIIVGG